LIIYLIKKIKSYEKIKYRFKLHYVMNHIIVKIHNDCIFFNKTSG
jgi:hypothetical protein